MDSLRKRGGKKGSKVGRNKRKPSELIYTILKWWIINKAKKIIKYLKTHPKMKFTNLNEEIKQAINKIKSEK